MSDAIDDFRALKQVYDNDNREEDRANARLIAAAPDMYEALEQIANWQPREFEMSSDWAEQIDQCEDCRNYAGHPIQRGICDKHRRPLWDRDMHDQQQRELRGLYARDIARAALAKARGAA